MAKKRDKKKDKKSRRKQRKFDPDKLEKRIKKGQENTGRTFRGILKSDKDYPRWIPKDGAHIIDIVPYAAGKNDSNTEEGDPTYTFEYWAHPNVGINDAMVLCPTDMYGDPCPICEDRKKLREANAKEEKWKRLFPKRRNLYNIICYDKGEAEKGVQIFDVSYHYMEKNLMAISKKISRTGGKERRVNFAHPEKGKSISFEIEPAKGKNDYPKFVGHSFDDREDYEIDDDILEAAFCLDECVAIMDYDEIKELYYHEKNKGKGGGPSNKEGLLEELEDLDDMEDLEEFIEEHDLDVKIRKKDDEDDVKEKIEKAIEEEEEEEEVSAEDIRDMKKKKLIKLIEDEDLDIDPDDFDDVEELQDEIIDEMDLDGD